MDLDTPLSSLAALSQTACARQQKQKRKHKSEGSKALKVSAKTEDRGTLKLKVEVTMKTKRKRKLKSVITIIIPNVYNGEVKVSKVYSKKRRRSSLVSSSTFKIASSASKTTDAKMRKSSDSPKTRSCLSDESRIDAWMHKANRPLTAKRVKEEMGLTLSVDQTTEALTALRDRGSIDLKQIGKSTIYWTPQKKSANDGADIGKRLKLRRLTKESKQLAAEKKRLQAELKSLTSAPSTSLSLALANEIDDKKVTLTKMSDSKTSATEQLLELHKYMRAWKLRKAAATKMIESLFPESEARDIIQKRLDRDTDASAKADMKSLDSYWKAACIQKRKIQGEKKTKRHSHETEEVSN